MPSDASAATHSVIVHKWDPDQVAEVKDRLSIDGDPAPHQLFAHFEPEVTIHKPAPAGLINAASLGLDPEEWAQVTEALKNPTN